MLSSLRHSSAGVEQVCYYWSLCMVLNVAVYLEVGMQK